MPTEILKSPSQLKYEIEKTQHELSSLLSNWDKKKQATSAKLLELRAEKKVSDAVMAQAEKGHQAYCLLLSPLAELCRSNPDQWQAALSTLEHQHPALAAYLTQLLRQAESLSPETADPETGGILRARETHQTTTGHIQRKTRDLYAAMQEEKAMVETYSAHLTDLMAEKQEHLRHQVKIYGPGL